MTDFLANYSTTTSILVIILLIETIFLIALTDLLRLRNKANEALRNENETLRREIQVSNDALKLSNTPPN